MARRRRRHARRVNGRFVSSGSAPIVVRRSSPSVKVVRVSAPRAVKVHRRRSGGGRSLLGGLGGIAGGQTPIILGALVLGFAHREKWLDKIPVIGKAGPITSFGLLGWGAEKLLKLNLPPLLKNAVTASLAISAFNVGFSHGDTIVGEQTYPGGFVAFD